MNKRNIKHKKKISNGDLADELAIEYGISKTLAKDMVNSVIGYMVKGLLRGQILSLRNFLTASRYFYGARVKSALNQTYRVDDTYKVKFVLSNTMKDKLQEEAKNDTIVKKVKEFEPKNDEDIDFDMDLLKDVKKNL